MAVTLSVIIVNYNGNQYLKDCFESLYRNLTGISFEIIVIDNQSTDESCGFIKTHFPEIRLIESQQNLGFGKGNNTAARFAKGKYLLLLNNDTILLDRIAPVFELLEKHPDIGAATIKMLDAKREYAVSVGDFPNFTNMFRMKRLQSRGLRIAKDHFSKEYYEADWVSGSFIAMPKRVFEEINGFDDDYFLYVEDVDLSKKIADKGYRRIFIPGLCYIHFVGFNTSKNRLLVNGYRIFISKHFQGAQKAVMLSALTINSMVKMVKNLLKID